MRLCSYKMQKIDGSKNDYHLGRVCESDLLRIGSPACGLLFGLGQEVVLLSCGHAYHTGCVDEWLLEVGS